jgi:predicted nucleic acid-binding protein
LDTNVIIALLAGNLLVVARIQSASSIPSNLASEAQYT